MAATARTAEPPEAGASPKPMLPTVDATEPALVSISLDRPVYERVKRLFDIVFATLMLIIAVPSMLVAAVAIKATSRGPVIYRHTRVGRADRPFVCLKLRTMIVEADVHLTDPEFAATFKVAYKVRRDPRVTRVGRFLRLTALDEVPQLINVLRGEMSLVGPRPVLEPELREMYGEFGPEVISVLPGMTGLWQVSGRSSLPYERRVELDLDYVRRRSLLLDLTILLRTPVVLLFMRGAV